MFFLLAVLVLRDGAETAATDFFSSWTCFFCSPTFSWAFFIASLGPCDLLAEVFVVPFVGVWGRAFAVADTGMGESLCSAFCFSDLTALAGVAARIGVTGITGTAGVMVAEVVLDMGLDPGREKDSSTTARGIAGAVKPGGIDGVARRGCSYKCVPIGVLGVFRNWSFSFSLTRASTSKDASSSALSCVLSMNRC